MGSDRKKEPKGVESRAPSAKIGGCLASARVVLRLFHGEQTSNEP